MTAANAERYRERDRARHRRARRGRAHLPLHPGAGHLAPRDVARHAARRPRRLLRVRARGDRPQAGHRGRLRPRPRGPHGRAAGRARLGLRRRARSTSSATARWTTTTTTCGRAEDSADKVWRTYFTWLGEAAATGLFDVLAHPDLVKYWGRERPLARQGPALLLRHRDGADRRLGHRGRGLDGRAAQAGRRDLPAARSWRWSSTPATRSRCPATRTRPSSSATNTTRRWSCWTTLGVTELARLRAPAARLEPIG